MLDEIERSLHDSLCIVKRALESNRVVPGGGAVEAALSVYLEHVADSMVRGWGEQFCRVRCCMAPSRTDLPFTGT